MMKYNVMKYAVLPVLCCVRLSLSCLSNSSFFFTDRISSSFSMASSSTSCLVSGQVTVRIKMVKSLYFCSVYNTPNILILPLIPWSVWRLKSLNMVRIVYRPCSCCLLFDKWFNFSAISSISSSNDLCIVWAVKIVWNDYWTGLWYLNTELAQWDSVALCQRCRVGEVCLPASGNR